MACTPQIRFAQPQAGSCIAQELVDYLNSSAEITSACNPTNTVGIWRGPNPPGVDDTDLIWLRTDTSNNDLYLLSFTNGRWRRLSGCPIGLKAFYNGSYSANFDITTGKGIFGGEWDGWETRFSDANKFVVEAESYNGSAWLTSITGAPLTTGGVASNTLISSDVPITPTPAVVVGNKGASSVTRPGDGALYGFYPDSGSTPTTLVVANPGNVAPTAFTNVPPFVSYVLVEYVGTQV